MQATNGEKLEDVASRFAGLARHFCALVEDAPHQESGAFLRTMRRSLPELYLTALALPDVEPATNKLADRGKYDEWKRLCSNLETALGPTAWYWETWPPRESEAVATHIPDDLADIHSDLKVGLSLVDAGAPAADIVWEWRFSFHSHWGAHVVGALRAIHFLLDYEHVYSRD